MYVHRYSTWMAIRSYELQSKTIFGVQINLCRCVYGLRSGSVVRTAPQEKGWTAPLHCGRRKLPPLDVSNGALVRWLWGLFTMMNKAAKQLYVQYVSVAPHCALPARCRARRASVIVRSDDPMSYLVVEQRKAL